MKNLAEALVAAVAFLELSDDNTVDPDDAIRALESIGAVLQNASTDEVVALGRAAAEEGARQSASGANDEVKEFYDSFLENFGLTAET